MKTALRDGLQFVRDNDLHTVWQAFNRRDTHPVLQFFKYGLCGILAMATHLLVFYALAYSALPAVEGMIVQGTPIDDSLRARNATLANFAGFFVANFVGYATNVLWVFQPARHHRIVEFLLFTGVAFLGFLAGLLGGPLLIRLFGISTHLAQIFFVVTSVAVNYLCRKFLIFKQ